MAADNVKGHLDSLLLAVLEDGPLHGYAVIEALQRRSAGELDLPTGTVYPALRRLENAGWLRGSWSTVGGRRRRTYTLTSAGRRALSDRRSEWMRFSGTIQRVLGGSGRAQSAIGRPATSG
ncbi:PadR family transcriptional regulator [Microlunatus soli]|uniref:DNA-binding transcriptional regulator, PadR family n=1 Tax=Microlunatus soli TaxID=630515 RepID=A0A1H1Y1P9_9ACTN|nr:helix-turn-helix transcriptional regulator [Microlunatus soli]SDT15388.1 DNA-binding transcriptional regulator, PadR family [Microlunatus soli]